MGLDMYLYLKKDGEDKDSELGYWRKANAVHRWFVQNVQGGIDDCEPYRVSKSNLKELFDTCQTVLDNPDNANEILPTSSGFFFGATNYDTWYFENLRSTMNICRKAMITQGEIFYQASW
jgi:hypothetical protein